MDQKDATISFMGVLIIMGWGAFGLSIPNTVSVHAVIYACEAPLPRDQHCVLKAVPESKETKP